LVLKSTYRGDMTVSWSPFVVDEITILGSRCGPFTPALRLLESAQVDPAILIADQFPLANSLEAMAAAQQPGMLKVLLKR
jgi:threonine dehydrogenase-like Zn-dependent dehydrogenase